MKDKYIGITQPLNIVSRAYANLDAKYGPYNSIENALENIPMSLRVQGLTVGIIIDNEIKEYWWKNGIDNNKLVPKTDIDNKVDKEVDSFLMTRSDRSLLYSLRDKQPIIIDGFWAFWDENLQEYVKSEFSAVGDGSNSPYINPETGTWWEWNPDINDYHDTGIKAKGEDGKDGIDGTNGIDGISLPGQIPIQKEWKINDLHRNNDEIVDYIYYRDEEDVENSKWVKLKEKGDVQNTSATPSGTLYEEITWLKNLAVNVLLVEEANLAGFIFKEGILFSQRGKVNGVEVDYNRQPNFIPNIVLDGKTGRLIAVNADIQGKIESNSEGTKIILDPIERAIIGYNNLDLETFKLYMHEFISPALILNYYENSVLVSNTKLTSGILELSSIKHSQLSRLTYDNLKIQDEALGGSLSIGVSLREEGGTYMQFPNLTKEEHDRLTGDIYVDADGFLKMTP